MFVIEFIPNIFTIRILFRDLKNCAMEYADFTLLKFLKFLLIIEYKEEHKEW